MFNPFKPLELIKAEVFTSLPTQFRNRSRTAWSDPNRQGAEVECFLEGPSFDREGNLWIVDIPFGRIFRISPQKNQTLYITEALSGDILTARMPVAGELMYGLQ
jgi:gluconolactonase